MIINYGSIQFSGISFGGVTLSFYWLFFIFGLFIVHRLITASFRTGNFSIYDKENSKFIDYPKAVNKIVLWAAIGWQVGGRIGYLLLHFDKDSFTTNPLLVFPVMADGLSPRLAVVGALAATWIVAKRLKLSTLKLVDILSFVTPTFIFLLRITDFLMTPAPGRPTNMNYGVIFSDFGSMPRHPLRLYQALIEGLVLQLILVLNKKQFAYRGRITCFFLLGYVILGQLVTELFRDFEIMPENRIGLISFRHLTALVLACLAFYISFKRRDKDQPEKD